MPLRGAYVEGARAPNRLGQDQDRGQGQGQAEGDGGGAFDADKRTLGDYLQRWLNYSVKNTVKPITFESYERRVRAHLSPALGHLRLGGLSPANWQSPYGRRVAGRGGCGPRTRARNLS